MMLAPWEESYDNPRHSIKKQRHHFATKGPYTENYGFSNSHLWMWELDHKEGWVLKNWCFWIMVLEKTLENPLDSKEIKPVNPKGNQPWIFTGRTVAEAEAPVFWPPEVKSQLTGENLDVGTDGRQRRSGEQRMRWLGGISDSVDSSLNKLREGAEDRGTRCATVCGVTKSWVHLSDLTITTTNQNRNRITNIAEKN